MAAPMPGWTPTRAAVRSAFTAQEKRDKQNEMREEDVIGSFYKGRTTPSELFLFGSVAYKL